MFRAISILSSLSAGFFLALACEATEELGTQIDCARYCDKALECNGDLDRDECEADCEDTLNDCMADERDEAQEQLETCADSSCDDFLGCTVEAGAQCFFGLG